jgi:hypothetical protein
MMGTKRRGTRPGLSLAAAALVSLACCARPLLVARPYPPPAAAELAEAITMRQRSVTAMNARARATSWLGGQRVRATVLMLVDRPGRLRFEAEVSLQGTVAVLATDGRRFAFLDTNRNELRRGPACPANVASLIRIPLGPSEVAAILLGDARLPAPTGAAEAAAGDGVVDWDPVHGADVLVVRRNDGWLRVLFQRLGGAEPARHEDRIIGAVATGPDGRPRWRVGFEDFAAVESSAGKGAGTGTGVTGAASVSLPRTIRFAEGDAPFDEGVEIKFKDRSVNESIADAAFELAPAPGTVTIEVGCPSAASPAR